MSDVKGTIKTGLSGYKAHEGSLVIVTGDTEYPASVPNPFRETIVINGNWNSASVIHPIVSDNSGVRYLYNADTTGQNTDRGMTQKAITDFVNSAIINGGTTAPTTATVGSVGTLYSCVESGAAHLYSCTDVSGSTYTWSQLV